MSPLEQLLNAWPGEHVVPSHETWKQVDSSKVTEYMRCPRRYFYRYVLGWVPDIRAVDLEVGSAIHLAMDVILTNARNAAISDSDLLEAAYETFLTRYRSIYSEYQDEGNKPKDPGTVYFLLQLYIAQHRNDPWELVQNELPSAADIGDGISIIGRIDALLRRDEDGLLMVDDHKTTTADRPTWRAQWNLAFAMHTYLHMVACIYGPDQVWGGLINGLILRVVDPNGGLYVRGPKKGTPKPDCGPAIARHEIHFTQEQRMQWLVQARYWYDQIALHLEILGNQGPDDPVMQCFPMNTTACTAYNKVCSYMPFCTDTANPLSFVPRTEATGGAPLGFTKEFWNPETHETVRVGGQEDLRMPSC